MISQPEARELMRKAIENKRKLVGLETGWHRVIVSCANEGDDWARLAVPVELLAVAKARMQELGFSVSVEDRLPQPEESMMILTIHW